MEQEQHGTFPGVSIRNVMAVDDDFLDQELVSHWHFSHGPILRDGRSREEGLLSLAREDLGTQMAGHEVVGRDCGHPGLSGDGGAVRWLSGILPT